MTFNQKKNKLLARLQSTMSSILGEQTHIFKMVGENQDFMLVIDRQLRIHDFHGGDNSQSGCTNLLIYNFFAENCMKMKEFGLRGGRVPGSANACTKGMY